MTATVEERMRRVTEKVAMYLLDDETEEVPMRAPELKPIERELGQDEVWHFFKYTSLLGAYLKLCFPPDY
jgi:hypothetical protein